MPIITSECPFKPLIDDSYTRVISRSSNGSRQDYVDYTLAQSVDPARCIAIINNGTGHYYSMGGRAHSIGFLAEIPDQDTLRLWVGGAAVHDLQDYTYNIPIIIYKFGLTPKRIETVMTTGNAIGGESVSLSSSVNLSKSAIFGAAAGSLNWIDSDCNWDDNDSISFNYTIGCIVVEFY